MHIKEAIDNIMEKKLDLMKENLEAALMQKVVEKLEERKIDIAQNYFSKLDEENTSAKEV
jgi:hypothetical protein